MVIICVSDTNGSSAVQEKVINSLKIKYLLYNIESLLSELSF